MELYDQHLHSRHSFDSDADPRANVQAAMARGLSGLTFTEHFDTHPEEWEACRFDDRSYSFTIERLRAEFGDRIFVGKGIEVCYQPARMPFILEFLAAHTFDQVILSVHYFGEHPVHVRQHWDDVDLEAGTRLYLDTVRHAARYCERLHREQGRRVFDVLGHLDFAKRYTHRWFGAEAVASCSDLIDDALRACIAADVVPEVNTSTWRQGLDEPMPGPSIVRRYVQLGGTAMSLGSDAHRPEDVGADFGEAVAMWKDAGITDFAVHKNRVRQLIPVD